MRVHGRKHEYGAGEGVDAKDGHDEKRGLRLPIGGAQNERIEQKDQRKIDGLSQAATHRRSRFQNEIAIFPAAILFDKVSPTRRKTYLIYRFIIDLF